MAASFGSVHLDEPDGPRRINFYCVVFTSLCFKAQVDSGPMGPLVEE